MSMFAITWGVCLALAAGPKHPPTFVNTRQFTLAWTHSIEKTRWEEDYQVVAPRKAGELPQLIAKQARIRGSAAGMEPPPDARLEDGWYHYQPSQPPETALPLMRSGYVADYEICMQGTCEPMETRLPSDGGITLLYACQAPANTP